MKRLAKRLANSEKMRSRSVEIAMAVAITLFAVIIMATQFIAPI